MTFLKDGLAALIEPLDTERLPAADRAVLTTARATLARLGFSTVAVPTVAERISRFQSPVNIVPFRHRDNGRHLALVPDFPDLTVSWSGRPASLDDLVAAVYRRAGVEPRFVEDRFHSLGGNTHCALVALH